MFLITSLFFRKEKLLFFFRFVCGVLIYGRNEGENILLNVHFLMPLTRCKTNLFAFTFSDTNAVIIKPAFKKLSAALRHKKKAMKFLKTLTNSLLFFLDKHFK